MSSIHSSSRNKKPGHSYTPAFLPYLVLRLCSHSRCTQKLPYYLLLDLFFPLPRYKQQLEKLFRNYKKSCLHFSNSLSFLLQYIYSSLIFLSHSPHLSTYIQSVMTDMFFLNCICIYVTNFSAQ